MESTLSTLHLLAAMVWVGGTIALVFVAVPVVRRLSGEERAAALRGLGRRWRLLGWGSLALLVVTGAGLAAEHGAFRAGSGFGVLLLVKIGLVAVMIALAWLHDFVLGPRLAREIRDGRAQVSRRPLVVIGWATLLLTAVVPILGVALSRLE